MAHFTEFSAEEQAAQLKKDWETNLRWKNTTRKYSAEEVVRLRGTFQPPAWWCKKAAEKLWAQIDTVGDESFVNALGAVTGNQAVQMAKAGLRAVYLSGWQVAADANLAGQTYPDQSLYPYNSAPVLVKRINQALQRADQVETMEGQQKTDYFLPIIADAEAGFGGQLNVFELAKQFIEAGAAGIHLEDQLASEKKCGHMGGKVLVPTAVHIRTLTAARLAADVCGAPLIIVGRTDSRAASLLTSDIDPYDHKFIPDRNDRTPEGFFKVRNGHEAAIHRALAYAPYCDLLWMETAVPDLDVAKAFAEAIHAKFPGKPLAYNCSPSFNWKASGLSDDQIRDFQKDLGKLGYKFQFVTLAGFHSLNFGMFQLAKGYRERQMAAYVEDLQEPEFAAAKDGYTAAKHQREVGASYFDQVALTITQGAASTLAVKGSTEEQQFN